MRLKLYRGKWAAVWSEDGRTKRHSFKTANRDEAEIEFRDWQHKKAALSLPRGRITVGMVLQEYFTAKPGVIKRQPMIDWWKNRLPEHVNEKTIAEYFKARGERSASTHRSEVGILQTALRWAKDKGWTVKAPKLELPAGSSPREAWITWEEAMRLIGESKSGHMQLFTSIAVYTGARAGAILDLTWDRVTERFIDFNVPGKATSRKRRAVVPINKELWPTLLAGREAAVTDYVIEYGGEKVASVKKAFERQAKRAGLGKIGPHTLRHSVATWLAMKGVSMREIAQLLGNSERMVERVYAKYAPGFLDNAVDNLGSGQVVHLNRSLRDGTGTASNVDIDPTGKAK
jgi:integrase